MTIGKVDRVHILVCCKCIDIECLCLPADSIDQCRSLVVLNDRVGGILYNGISTRLC